MLENITYYPIFEIPLIVYIGILTIIFLLITASTALLKRKQIIKLSIKWHHKLAYLSILLGLIHSILAILLYF